MTKVLTRKQMLKLRQLGIKYHILCLKSPTELDCQMPGYYDENNEWRVTNPEGTLDLPPETFVHLDLTEGLRSRSVARAKNLKYEIEFLEELPVMRELKRLLR